MKRRGATAAELLVAAAVLALLFALIAGFSWAAHRRSVALDAAVDARRAALTASAAGPAPCAGPLARAWIP